MNHLWRTQSLLFKVIFLIMLVTWGFNLTTLEIALTWSFGIQIALFVLSVALILFAFIPWHGKRYAHLGLNDHYQKILVIATYLLLINNVIAITDFSTHGFSIFLIALFVLAIAINFVLLLYHFKDKDKTPPAYFAANLYLKNSKEDQKS